MLVGNLLVSLFAAFVVAAGVLLGGHGPLLALVAYSLSGSLTLLLLAALGAIRGHH